MAQNIYSRLGFPRLSATNAHGLTPRQEVFASLVARGKTLSDAYRATYTAPSKYSTVNVSASKLAKLKGPP